MVPVSAHSETSPEPIAATASRDRDQVGLRLESDPQAQARAGLRSRKKRRRRLIRGLAMLTAILILGGGTLAYRAMTDNTKLIGWIISKAPRYLPTATLEIQGVQLHPLRGEITFNQVRIRQSEGDRGSPATLQFAWMNIHHDASDLAQGRFQPERVLIVQPRLDIRRRADGSWNLGDLLADPWPDPPPTRLPTIELNDGIIFWTDLGMPEGIPKSLVLMRDLELALVPQRDPDLRFRFEGRAKGTFFHSINFQGWFDPKDRSLKLDRLEVEQLKIDPELVLRLPPMLADPLRELGLSSGQIDLVVEDLHRDPNSPCGWAYQARADLRRGRLEGPQPDGPSRLPFPLEEVSAQIVATPSAIAVVELVGTHGRTRVTASGVFDPVAQADGPYSLQVKVTDLELDRRILHWNGIPPVIAEAAQTYQISGRLDLEAHILRQDLRNPDPQIDLTLTCQNVRVAPPQFPYQFDRIHGLVHWDGTTLRLGELTLLVGRPSRRGRTQGGPGAINTQVATVHGHLTDPGPEAKVFIDFQVDDLPIDQTFRDALPPSVRTVVNQFQPTGSASVTATLIRGPSTASDDWIIHALLLPKGDGSITYDGWPYPINHLTGDLLIEPNRWVFQKMQGDNGQVQIRGHGEVWQPEPSRRDEAVRRVSLPAQTQIEIEWQPEPEPEAVPPLAVDIHLEVDELPFDDRLYRSLPPVWKDIWATLNPEGLTEVEVDIRAGQPDLKDDTSVRLTPNPNTNIQLSLPPLPGKPGQPVVLPPMRGIDGYFHYKNGKVYMRKVGFEFWDAQVESREGLMQVHETGQFDLVVADLEVRNLHLNAGLRQYLPGEVAEVARQIGPQRLALFRTNMGIHWSGQSGQPATCDWNDGLIVLDGNTLNVGVPLKDIRGELNSLRGNFDGREITMTGAIEFNSMLLHGVQVTNLETPLRITRDRAALTSLQAKALGGVMRGNLGVFFESTPRYEINLGLEEALLSHYTRTIPGHQQIKGRLRAWLTLRGLGSELSNLNGSGSARIDGGELGELPTAIALFKAAQLKRPDRNAFDVATVDFQVQGGRVILKPIELVGDAFTLRGEGQLDRQMDLNALFSVLPGRRGSDLPIIGDWLDRTSGELLVIRVRGPVAMPEVATVPLPRVSATIRALDPSTRR